jgi:hypothetical protein
MIGCGERHTSPSLVSLQFFRSFPTIAAYFAGLRLDFRKIGVITCLDYPIDYYTMFYTNYKCSTALYIYILAS